MTIRPVILVLAFVLLPALAACRADDYAGHRTSRRSSTWALSQMSERYSKSVNHFEAMVDDAVPALERNVSTGTSAIERTWNMYRHGSPNSPDPTLLNRKRSGVVEPADDREPADD
jgi:hypothetical protein